MKKIALVAATMLGACGAAQAQEPQAQTQRAGPDRQLCRTVSTTGSILGGRRQCRTAEEWHRLDQRARQSLDGVGPRDPTLRAR